MILTADFHTHTTFSHGKNTPAENIRRAKELGLAAIGCTDHGFSHWAFGIKRKEVPQFIREIRAAERETGVRSLVGIESNICGISGLCDLTERDLADFDLYLAGFHIVVHYETLRDHRFGVGNMLRNKLHIKPSASLVRDTTRAYINAVQKNPIDILVHLNFGCLADAAEVAKCCRDYGTYLEISSKKRHLTDDELAAAAATGVRFVINSDAHSVDRIGDTALAMEQISRVGIPLQQIDNIEGRMPQLRLAEYKRRHL